MGPWSRLWFEPRPTRVLGLTRIALGLVALYSIALWLPLAGAFYSDAGVLRAATFREAVGRPCPSLLLWLDLPGALPLLLLALALAAVTFTLGWRARTSALALYVALLSLHERNPYGVNGGDVLLRNLILFFALAPRAPAWSLDALLLRWRGGTPSDEGPVLVQRLVQAQVVWMYLATALWKAAQGAAWHDLTALYWVAGRVEFVAPGVEQALNFPRLLQLATAAVLLLELALPVLLVARPTRALGLLLGAAMHLGIAVFLLIPLFSAVVLASYAAFLEEGWLAGALLRARVRLGPPRARATLGAGCADCARLGRALAALDLTGRVERVEGAGAAGLTVDGAPLAPAQAARWLTWRLPALWPLAPLLWLPGVAGRLGARWTHACRAQAG